MEEAIRRAFLQGDFEGVLDKLSVPSMNTQVKDDGRTALMAACVHGNKAVAALLLDMVCSETTKDNTGKTAVEYAMEAGHHALGDEIRKRRVPPFGQDGKPVFTWDTCSHPPECKYLDEEIGWLICTGCGLVLQEKAIQISADDNSNPYKSMAAVRGADAEYNSWRAQELELADIMSKLGVVDNEAAKRHGEESSIWAARRQALAWLDRRKRHIASWEHRAKLARLHHEPIPTKQAFSAYVRGLNYEQEKPTGAPTAIATKQEEARLPRFRGKAPPPEIPVEEEELIDPAQIFAEKYAPRPTRWRVAVDRWNLISRAALRWSRMSGLEEWRAEEESEVSEDEAVAEQEREIEWEYT